MTATISQVADDLGVSQQYAGALISEADNLAKWSKLDAELNDLMEVVEDGGD